MIGRRAVIGLSLLSALLVCAFAAQSASAVISTSKNTTAFTCVEKVGAGDFEDEHCDNAGPKPGKERFAHVLIPNKTVTKVHVTNEKTTESTKKSEPATLEGTVALVKTAIECTTVTGNPAGSTLENSEPEVGKHTVKGTAQVEYTNCKVENPAKCTVDEPIIAEATVHGVEGLEGPKGEKNAMGLEFVGKGEKEQFASITFRGPECALKDKTFAVNGKAYGTSGPTTKETGQEAKHSGATLVFTPEFKMQELKFGGVTANFKSIVTVRMAEEKEKTEPPISLTTTT